MNQQPTPSPTIPTDANPEVIAAVAREARFKDIEASHSQLTLRFDNFMTLYARDRNEQRERDETLLDISKQALAAANKTNGSVAECMNRLGQHDSLISDQGLDILELSGGLQAAQKENLATRALFTSTAQKDEVDGAKRAGFWEALRWEWKLAGAIVLVSGMLVSLAANVTTLVHLVR